MTDDQFEKLAQLIKVTAEETKEELSEELGGRIDVLATEVAGIKATMATRNDVREIVEAALEPIHDKIENVTGYRKEIDHVIERIAAVEQRIATP